MVLVVEIPVMDLNKLMVSYVLATLCTLVVIDLEVAGTAKVAHVLHWLSNYTPSEITPTHKMLKFFYVSKGSGGYFLGWTVRSEFGLCARFVL